MFQVARRDPIERKQLKLCDPAEKGLSGQGNPRAGRRSRLVGAERKTRGTLSGWEESPAERGFVS